MEVMKADILQTQKELEGILADAGTALARVKALKKTIAQEEMALTQTATTLEKKLGKSLDANEFIEFFKKPYVVIPQSRHKALVVVPKFVKGFTLGWLLRETPSFYIYEFDQYSAWLGDAPADLLKEIDFAPQFKASIQGNRITFNREDKDEVKKKLNHLISEGTLTDTDAIIKKGRQFDVIVEMVKSGCLPFRPTPVAKEDLRSASHAFRLRPYQEPVAKKFLDTGAVGAFQPTSAGKSFIAMHCMDIVAGPKLLFVPNNTLKEQWHAYIEANVPRIKDEVQIYTYNASTKHFNNNYSLVVFDECHRLPADTFSRLALIRTKYRLGLSATPHREDGREAYIFALTGFPVGLNWADFMQERGREYHPVYVHIANSKEGKLRKVAELLNTKKKTFIFCDGLELGREVARRFNIPYVHGETTDRMRIIEDNTVVAISRVGDEGVSVKDLQQVIEIDFAGGSRRQELQRTGRLMHSEVAGRHDIIMTEKELADHGKRIWALQEKGFIVKVLA